MKKILVVAICSVIFVMFNAVVNAEEVEGLTEKIDALIMEKNFTQDQLKRIDEQYLRDYDDWFWNRYLEPAKQLGKMNTDSDEEEYEYCLERNRPNYKYGVLVTEVGNKYAQQYSENNVFSYLLDERKKYWAVMPCRGFGISIKCRGDGSRIYDMKDELGEQYDIITLTTNIIDFLREGSEIKKQLLKYNEEKVTDVQLFSVKEGLTLLYVKCISNEYLMKLYGNDGSGKCIPQIEEFVLYPAQMLIDALTLHEGDDWPYRQLISRDMLQTKNTYDTEAESLQADGLLNGNEKGLDLLKPLTRIEATAILVRAMGLEDTQTSDTSYFADIQSDNWGAKYANIAKDKGIADGIGDNLFAPNDTITASQFATLILRNQGENPDWQTAINTFVERGLITSEQAEKMDLFARGDMAKIIYEAKQRNMF